MYNKKYTKPTHILRQIGVTNVLVRRIGVDYCYVYCRIEKLSFKTDITLNVRMPLQS